MCRTTLKQHFDLVTLFDLTLTLVWPWPLLSISSMLICYVLHCIGSLLAESGLAAVISPVSVADKAKSDDFDLWPDLFDLLWRHRSSERGQRYYVWCNSMRSFERRLNFFSDPTIRSGETEGGPLAPPPIRTCNLPDPIRARVNQAFSCIWSDFEVSRLLIWFYAIFSINKFSDENGRTWPQVDLNNSWLNMT